MSSRQLAFYRSHVTQVAFVITGVWMAFAFSPWGPTGWRQTPSLRWLHHLLPWSLLAVAFVVYVLLVLIGGSRIVAAMAAGYLGLFLYLLGLIAILCTLHESHKWNPFAINGIILACVLHYGAARLATFQRERL